MPQLQITLLGQFALRLDGQPIAMQSWGSQSAQRLVKLLALTPQYRLRVEAITDALWPAADLDKARRLLYQAVYAARKVLDPQRLGLLTVSQEQVQLGLPGEIETDLHLFLTASRQAQQRRQLADYTLALALYAGPLLPADITAEWAMTLREQAHRTYLHLLSLTATAYQAQGELLLARQTWERLLAAEPTDEPAHVALIELALAQGQRTQALQQYQTLCTVLARELDATPSAATNRLYQQMLQEQLPTATAGATTPNIAANPATQAAAIPTLPLPLTPLFGREAAVDNVVAQLQQTRLVTLAGPGGVGKTRLALAVAQSLATAGEQAIWWVELANLTNPDLVPATVAQVLRVLPTADQTLEQGLIAYGQQHPFLLVLDNCEHLLAACAALTTTLLTHCAAVRLLTTSRAALRVASEVVWQVPPLPVPATTGAAPTVAEYRALVTNPAAQLLLSSVQTRQPDWTLPRQEVAALVQVCQQVEGIPLALELAAARLTLLPLPQLAQRLQRALILLTDGPRSAPERHQTLRATLDWSFRLLSVDDQWLLAELSVFVGNFTLDAAEAVSSFSDATLPGLARLSEQSLVQVLPPTSENATIHYRLLEPVRQYAREHLDHLDDTAVVQERHAAWFASLAATLGPQLNSDQPAPALRQLQHALPNLRAALQWYAPGEQAPAGLAMLIALEPLWQSRDLYQEGMIWLTKIYAHLQTSGEPEGRIRALAAAARLTSLMGHTAQALPLLETALPLARVHGDQRLLVAILHPLYLVERYRGQIDQSWAYTVEARAIYQQLNTPLMAINEVIAIHNLSALALDRNDLATALEYSAEVLTRMTSLRAVRLYPYANTHQAYLELAGGAVEAGLQSLQQALSQVQQFEDWRATAWLLCLLGWAFAPYAPATAAACLGYSHTLRTQSGLIPQEVVELRVIRQARGIILHTLAEAAYAAAHAQGETWDLPTAYRTIEATIVAYRAALAEPGSTLLAESTAAYRAVLADESHVRP